MLLRYLNNRITTRRLFSFNYTRNPLSPLLRSIPKITHHRLSHTPTNMTADTEIADLIAQEEASRARNKENKKRGDKDAEKKEIEVLKEIMKKKAELLKKKKAEEKEREGKSGEAAVVKDAKEKDGKVVEVVQGLKKTAGEKEKEGSGFTLKTPKVGFEDVGK